MEFKDFQRLRTGVACLLDVAQDPSYKDVGGYTYDGLYISLNSTPEHGQYTLHLMGGRWDHNDLARLERILWTFYLSECSDIYDQPLGRDDIGHYVTACFDADHDGAIGFAPCRARFDASLIPDEYSASQIDRVIFNKAALPSDPS